MTARNTLALLSAHPHSPDTRFLAHFFFMGQFCGWSGSSGPSNSTTYSSRSGKRGGYSFPPPNFGSGFLDSLDLRDLPTVPLCCDRCVSIRLKAVGWRSRSRCVFILDIPISSRTIEADDDVPVEDVSVESRPGVPWLSLFWAGKRSGLASRSAFSKSRSTIFIVMFYSEEVVSKRWNCFV